MERVARALPTNQWIDRSGSAVGHPLEQTGCNSEGGGKRAQEVCHGRGSGNSKEDNKDISDYMYSWYKSQNSGILRTMTSIFC